MSDLLVQESYLKILQEIGEDPAREGLIKTPARVAKAWEFFSKGYDESLDEVINGGVEVPVIFPESSATGVSTLEGPTSFAPAKLTPQILQNGALSSTSTAQTGHFFITCQQRVAVKSFGLWQTFLTTFSLPK